MPIWRGGEGAPHVTQVSDAVANDSDKTLVVPVGTMWAIQSIYARLVSTGTAGNRLLTVLFTNASDVPLFRYVAGGVQAASLTMDYVFAPNHPQETAVANNGLQLRALGSGITLLAGWKIRIYDVTAVDPAADDLTLQVLIESLQVSA